MKKLFTIITLLMSSFFLFSINEVRADSYTYELTEEHFSKLNDEFYNFREKVIKYVQDNNLHGYIIGYDSTNNYYEAFIAYDNYSLRVVTGSPTYNLRFSYKYFERLYLDSSGDFVIKSTAQDRWSSISILSDVSDDTLINYLDTDMPLTYTDEHEYTINFNDKTYLINNGATMPTLYQIYLDNFAPVEPEDPYKEEKEIMNNFYSTIITKIGDLATSFASNYVFILILGIFILIFVFELIRRRLL